MKGADLNSSTNTFTSVSNHSIIVIGACFGWRIADSLGKDGGPSRSIRLAHSSELRLENKRERECATEMLLERG